MGKSGGKSKKKLAVPQAGGFEGKHLGNVGSLLRGSANSNERMCWRFTHVDHGGRWGFDRINADTLCEVLRKLAGCESMTLNELRRTSSFFKEYSLPSGLCREALARLTDLGHADMTKIQRLELTGKQRLYGFLDANVFHVLWWDPEHEVYPSKLKNT